MTSRSRFNAILTASSLPVILAASWLYYPAVFEGPTFCLLKIAYGTPCPGCGMTRAFACMMHGELGRGFMYHPLAPVVLAVFLIWWVLELRDLARGVVSRRPPAWFERIIGVTMALFLAFWCARLTAFFASPEGLRSVATKNLPMRILRWDWSNTHEPFLLDKPQARR